MLNYFLHFGGITGRAEKSAREGFVVPRPAKDLKSKVASRVMEFLRPFHTTMLLDAHQCASSSTAETMRIDRVHIVQLYKHSVAIELYRKVYPDALHVASNHLSSCNAR